MGADDRDGFLRTFSAFSEIGAKNGGLHRLTGTPEDGAARSLLISSFRERGYTVARDAIGNLFGFVLPPGERPTILLGSHLDSQPDGGRFDGQTGVVIALWAARVLEPKIRSGELPFNLGVVNWTNEEGARFQPSVLGSSVFTGRVPIQAALGATDSRGATLGDCLAAIDALGTDEVPLPSAYLEVHVEQGSILEREGVDIGVVEGAWGALKLDVQVSGVQTHTGPPPMEERVDALYATALLVTAVREMGLDQPGGRLHTTVGSLRITPDSPNCTPSEVRSKVELRSDDPAILIAARAELEKTLAEIGRMTGASLVVTAESLRETTRMWPKGPEILERAAAGCQLSSRRMKTVAGHDALVMNSAVPSLLFFLPSVGGHTHNRHELTEDRDLVNGLSLMVEAVESLGKEYATSPTDERDTASRDSA
ncbi:Zn-dependent hydrolase [Arthrobacter agilis]|uniref:Zn-dependent hydrolase n=1 Tax=Arthrobacter agilis TaxID=37921 RepID=UPI0027829EBC|nr:Zn-dependent hydrolase [Arthrobacter agilis]MDQ0733758.1 N-carbamoyl-L-amino-acid hydrolase [Arthrobacter agilis]